MDAALFGSDRFAAPVFELFPQHLGGWLSKQLWLMGQKLLNRYADECGAIDPVGVCEENVATDLFDGELDGMGDQELITIGDREILDGVFPSGEHEGV